MQSATQLFANQIKGVLKNAYSISKSGNQINHNMSSNYQITSNDKSPYHGRNGYNVPEQISADALHRLD
jgi:hypothetical protein